METYGRPNFRLYHRGYTIFLQTATHVVAETKQLRRFAKSFKNENKIVSHVQGVLRIWVFCTCAVVSMCPCGRVINWCVDDTLVCQLAVMPGANCEHCSGLSNGTSLPSRRPETRQGQGRSVVQRCTLVYVGINNPSAPCTGPTHDKIART